MRNWLVHEVAKNVFRLLIGCDCEDVMIIVLSAECACVCAWGNSNVW